MTAGAQKGPAVVEVVVEVVMEVVVEEVVVAVVAPAADGRRGRIEGKEYPCHYRTAGCG